MKKLLFALVLMCILIPSTAYAQGTGTESDPWHISNQTEFDQFKQATAFGSPLYAVLDNDLTVSNYSTASTVDVAFLGGFNGKGHTITINIGNYAMFPTIGENSWVKNLNISYGLMGTHNSVAVQYAAALSNHNKGTIENCTVTGNSLCGADHVGTIVGENYGGTIKNCKATIKTNVFSMGENPGTVGGLVGENYGVVENCIVDGQGTISNAQGDGLIGGIAGNNGGYYNDSLPKGSITGCIVEGNLTVEGTVKDYIAGITARNSRYSNGIYDCLVYDNVKLQGKDGALKAGGICAHQAKSIQKCFYNSGGGISGTKEAAPIISYRDNGAWANNHYNSDKTHLTDSRGTAVSNIHWLKAKDGVKLPEEISDENGLLRAGRSFYYGGKEVTLSYDGNVPSGKKVVYIVNGERVNGNKMTMPARESEVSAEVLTELTSNNTSINGEDVTYNGAAQNPTVSYGDKSLIEGTDYEISYKCNDEEVQDCVDAGTYTVTVNGIGEYTGSVTTEYIIDQADAAVLEVPKAKELTYNGEDQELVTAGDALGDFMYKVEGEDYDTKIPKKKNAGKYNVYCYVAENRNYKASEVYGPIEVEIKKAQAEFITKPTKKTLKFNGSEQELVTVGEVTGGTLKYRLDEWQEEIPIAKEVGKYPIYYMIEEDDNYLGTEEYGPINSKIEKVGTGLGKVKALKNGVEFTWNEIKGAKGYDVFFSKCGSKNKPKFVKTVKGTKWTKKGLKKDTAYKMFAKAFNYQNGKKTYIATTPIVHTFVEGKKYTMPKAIKLKKSKVTLAVGKTFKIKAKVIKKDSKKRLMPDSHAKTIRYKTSDNRIAKVKDGKITAVASGKCKVYAYTVNGISKPVTVTVK